jgi:hypothetical protein
MGGSFCFGGFVLCWLLVVYVVLGCCVVLSLSWCDGRVLIPFGGVLCGCPLIIGVVVGVGWWCWLYEIYFYVRL